MELQSSRTSFIQYCVCLALFSTLSACKQTDLEIQKPQVYAEDGISLNQAPMLSQHPIAASKTNTTDSSPLTEAEKSWVGRYEGYISCAESVSDYACVSMTYILHFTEDGYVYRNKITSGQVSALRERSNKDLYRVDTWSLSDDQQFLVAHLPEEIDVYWKILDDNTLSLDIGATKMNNGEQRYSEFNAKNAFPVNHVIVQRTASYSEMQS